MDKTVKTEVSAADLYVLLNRELRRRQGKTCAKCEMPLPFRVERRDADSPNWEVLRPPHCPRGCADMAESIVAQFGLLYDLRPFPSGSGPKANR